MTPSTALSDTFVFVRQFARTARTTGAIMPSGRALSRALVQHVQPGSPDQPRAVLEVGPGTGAVTRHLVQRLGPKDSLDLVEANAKFADQLAISFERDSRMAEVNGRVRLLRGLVQEHVLGSYDTIVCGLPFANFPPDQIMAIFRQLLSSLTPNGRLSFFSYSGGEAVCRVAPNQVHSRQALRSAVERNLIERELVMRNLPPAWVYHLAAHPPAQQAPAPAVPHAREHEG
jgi:phosphatidylethanolamine/phosphatidyl-N-methylethanolamine N-methyltransferase